MYYIGVDVGGMSIKGGLVTESGDIVARHTVETQRYSEEYGIAEDIRKVVDGVLAEGKVEVKLGKPVIQFGFQGKASPANTHAVVETEDAIVFFQVFVGLGRQTRDVARGSVVRAIDVYAVVEPKMELFVLRRKMQLPVFEIDPCRNTCPVFVIGLCFLGRSQYRKQSDGGGQQ